MKKLYTILMALAMQGVLSSHAQCPWTVQTSVTNPKCAGECTGAVEQLVTGYTPGFTFNYQWSNGSTGLGIYNLCAGSYTFTVTDDKGCSAAVTSVIAAPAPLVVNCSVIQANAPGTLFASASGGVGPYSYTWNTNPSQYTQTITGLAAGNYTVTVEDWNKCQANSNCDIVNSDCGGRTQTMGGWGAEPQGNNPGTYLHANFSTAFPNGLLIGCTNTLKLTTAQKVTDFLPCSGTPKALPAGNMINNVNYKNTFAGQLVAVTLSIGFDQANASFSPASLTLDQQTIASGPFSGMTVGQLVYEANKKIGGCNSPYTVAQLNEALTMVNENYVDGKTNNGNLYCDIKKYEGKLGNQVTEDVTFNVLPNPFSSNAFINVKSADNVFIQVELYDMAGHLAKNVYAGMAQAGENKMEIKSDGLNNGIYLLKVIAADKVYNKRVVIQK